MATRKTKPKAKAASPEPTKDISSSEPIGSSLHLWTTSDVTSWRSKLIKEQQGLDPITQEPLFGRSALDHDHSKTGDNAQRVRGVLSSATNAWEGRVLSSYYRYMKYSTDVPLSVLLKNLSVYYEKSNQHLPLHPAWIKTVTSAFSSLSEPSKALVIGELGKANASNSTARKKIFLDEIKSKKHSYNHLMELIQKFK